MKHCYLIFGSGFIAEHYTKHLLGRGDHVFVAFHNKKNQNIPSLIQQKAGDDIKSVKKMLNRLNPDYIVLTQGISFIPDNEKELRRSIESNVLSPLIVLEATYRLREMGSLKNLKKILTFGSAAEYGGENIQQWTENSHDTKPSSFYGLVKHWLFDTSRFYVQSNLPCVHLRLFNTVGAGQDSRFVFSSFGKQIAVMEHSKKPTPLSIGDIEQKRDFIDIRDVIRALDLIVKKAPPGQVVNICSGKTHRVRKIIDIVRKYALIDFDTKVDQELIVHKRTRNKTLAGTPSWLLKNGWRPKYSLEDSAKWVLEYWRKELSKKHNHAK